MGLASKTRVDLSTLLVKILFDCVNMPSSRPFEGSPCARARVAVSECSPFSFHFCVLLSLSFNHAAAASAALGDSSRNGSKRRKRGELSIRGRRKWRGGRDRTNDICRDGYTHNMLEHEDVFEIVSSPAIARRGEREVSLQDTPAWDGSHPPLRMGPDTGCFLFSTPSSREEDRRPFCCRAGECRVTQ